MKGKHVKESWLDATKRKAIYGAAAAIFGVLVVYGAISADNAEALLGLSDQILGFAAAVLAFVNTGSSPAPSEGA